MTPDELQAELIHAVEQHGVDPGVTVVIDDGKGEEGLVDPRFTRDGLSAFGDVVYVAFGVREPRIVFVTRTAVLTQ